MPTWARTSPPSGCMRYPPPPSSIFEEGFIEVSFDASGFASVQLTYRRMLVGFDAADDWEAQVFDGGWISAVRFKCETGAVSEKCYLDEVRIAGS